MRLKDIFIKMLKEKNIERVGTTIRKIISSDDPIKMMALYIANGRANICPSKTYSGISFKLDGNKCYDPPQAYVGRCKDVIFTKDELISKGYFPYIVIDCRYHDLHSKKEKKKLLLQIRQTLGVIREYMWDDRLIVTLKCGCGRYYQSSEDFLRQMDFKNVILLDPNAENIYNGEKADCYIIGGIVDKAGNKKGLTSKIGEELEKAGFSVDSRKIVLRGDTVGVPDRINHITEIILKVVLDEKSVEDAIREVQPPIIAKWRLRKELHEYTIRVMLKNTIFRILPKSVFNEFKWLNLRLEDFYRVCSEQKFIVVSDRLFEEVKRSKWDEKRRCYVLG